jgi:hypothetical protein
MVTFRGETRCLADLADEYGIHRETVQWRLGRGIDIETALTMPVYRGVRKLSNE